MSLHSLDLVAERRWRISFELGTSQPLYFMHPVRSPPRKQGLAPVTSRVFSSAILQMFTTSHTRAQVKLSKVDFREALPTEERQCIGSLETTQWGKASFKKPRAFSQGLAHFQTLIRVSFGKEFSSSSGEVGGGDLCGNWYDPAFFVQTVISCGACPRISQNPKERSKSGGKSFHHHCAGVPTPAIVTRGCRLGGEGGGGMCVELRV